MKKLVLFTLLLAACSQENSGNAIAKVNGEAVTKLETEKMLASFTGLETAHLENYPADFQKEFVNKYIEKKLLVEAAHEAGYDKDKEVQMKLKEAEEFLIEQKYLADLVKKESTDAKLKALYDEIVKNRAGTEEVKASHILVATEAEAKDIKKQLDGGADFAKLASAHSKDPSSKINGGELGYFTADKMVPAFSQAAFALKKGQISAPVKSDFGWHIIKVEDKRAVEIPTFEKAKPALQQEIARRALEDKIAELKKSAKIEISYDFHEAPKPEAKKADATKAADKEPAAGKAAEVK